MTTALLLAALVITSVGWWLSSENWRSAEEEVLRLCAQLRLAEERAWEAELRAEFAADESAP